QLIELAHLPERFERSPRLFLVDAGDGKADVDDYVVAGGHLARHVLEADVPADPAEIHGAHREPLIIAHGDDAAGNAETHGYLLGFTLRTRQQRGGRRQRGVPQPPPPARSSTRRRWVRADAPSRRGGRGPTGRRSG